MAFAVADNDDVVTFMVAAGLVYEIIAKCCSSPQTAELNAHARAATLMKWVRIGMIESAFFIAIAVMLDKKRWPAALGGGLAAAVTWWEYDYAKRCGLSSAEPGTETY